MTQAFSILSSVAHNTTPTFNGISLSQFNPFHRWLDNSQDHTGDLTHVEYSGREMRYRNSSNRRLESLLLAAVTPVVQGLSVLAITAIRIAKILSFSHFWLKQEGAYASLQQRLLSLGKDLLAVALAPIFLVGLECAAIYGIIMPHHGAKVYAACEKALFGAGLLAPCFQPVANSRTVLNRIASHPDVAISVLSYLGERDLAALAATNSRLFVELYHRNSSFQQIQLVSQLFFRLRHAAGPENREGESEEARAREILMGQLCLLSPRLFPDALYAYIFERTFFLTMDERQLYFTLRRESGHQVSDVSRQAEAAAQVELRTLPAEQRWSFKVEDRVGEWHYQRAQRQELIEISDREQATVALPVDERAVRISIRDKITEINFHTAPFRVSSRAGNSLSEILENTLGFFVQFPSTSKLGRGLGTTGQLISLTSATYFSRALQMDGYLKSAIKKIIPNAPDPVARVRNFADAYLAPNRRAIFLEHASEVDGLRLLAPARES